MTDSLVLERHACDRNAAIDACLQAIHPQPYTSLIVKKDYQDEFGVYRVAIEFFLRSGDPVRINLPNARRREMR
jgi:hypothetical protein